MPTVTECARIVDKKVVLVPCTNNLNCPVCDIYKRGIGNQHTYDPATVPKQFFVRNS